MSKRAFLMAATVVDLLSFSGGLTRAGASGPAMGYDPVVFRSVVLAVVLGLTVQATGALAVIAPDDCLSTADAAPDTTSDDCPDCLFCVCCSPLLPTVQTAIVDLVPVDSPLLSHDLGTPGLRDPDPHGILHVPRSA